MIDIVERLKEPEEHYPGNFDTPKRANAIMSCLCQEAAEEIESLRQQIEMAEACLAGDNALIVGLKNDIAEKDVEIARLNEQLAASQAREQQLRDELFAVLVQDMPAFKARLKVEAIPTDTTALQSMIVKAGEVMRERAISKMADIAPYEHRLDKLNAIPSITMDDLK